jgi:hypothetical protein
MHVFWYQALAKHRLVPPVRFEDGSFISVLRNKQLFIKMGGGVQISNLQIFDQFFDILKSRQKSQSGGVLHSKAA